MKIRNGFVSNSSSSSFCINKKGLNPIDLMLIKNYEKFIFETIKEKCPDELWTKDKKEYLISKWDIKETKTKIKFFTTMDNINLILYLNILGYGHLIEEFDGENTQPEEEYGKINDGNNWMD